MGGCWGAVCSRGSGGEQEEGEDKLKHLPEGVPRTSRGDMVLNQTERVGGGGYIDM